jgi:hypothetical protein
VQFSTNVQLFMNLRTSDTDGAILSDLGARATDYTNLELERLSANSAICFECFRNMAIRLLVNSELTVSTSAGDPTVASLWAYSNAKYMLALEISNSFA